MDVKEAIKFLNDIRYVNSFGDSVQNRKVDKIIAKLKRLEKYEAMWADIKKGRVYFYLDKYEEEYFPEEVKRMNDEKAIEKILKYYNTLKSQCDYYVKNNMNTDFPDGELCGIRCILTLVYGFEENDKRFKRR